MLPVAFFAVRDVGFHGGWRGLRHQDDSAAYYFMASPAATCSGR
jgi:hypothetical protein